MTKLSRSEQIVAEKTVCILLIRGENQEGNKIYAYVAIRADKLQEFMDAQRAGLFYPEDYGVIVESGEGEPAEEVKKKMTQEYGFNHENMIDIPDSNKALQIASGLSGAPKEDE